MPISNIQTIDFASNQYRSTIRDAPGSIWTFFNDGTLFCIYAAHSTDGGATWSVEIVSDPVIGGSNPQAVLDSNGVIHLFYVDAFTVYYRQRTLAGWQPILNVTADILTIPQPGGIAIDGGNNIHFLFNPGNTIRHQVKTPAAWQAAELVYNGGANPQLYPTLVVDRHDDLHVTWSGKGFGLNPATANIEYIKKTGIAWGPVTSITDYGGIDHQLEPSIAIGLDDVIHITWLGQHFADANPFTLRYRRFSGGAWQAEEVLYSTKSLSNTNNPIQLAVDENGEAHISWVNTHYGGYDLFGDFSLLYLKRGEAPVIIRSYPFPGFSYTDAPSMPGTLWPIIGGKRVNMWNEANTLFPVIVWSDYDNDTGIITRTAYHAGADSESTPLVTTLPATVI